MVWGVAWQGKAERSVRQIACASSGAKRYNLSTHKSVCSDTPLRAHCCSSRRRLAPGEVRVGNPAGLTSVAGVPTLQALCQMERCHEPLWVPLLR